jgi:ligand-binding sensor domain-containing protein
MHLNQLLSKLQFNIPIKPHVNWRFNGLICLLYFLCIQLSWATNYAALKGLTQVNAILQDQQGYLWFGGQSGLTRFDGESILTFSQSSQPWSADFSWVLNMRPVNNKFIITTENNGSWWFNPLTGSSIPIKANITKSSHYFAEEFKQNIFIHSMMTKQLIQLTPPNLTPQIIADNVQLEFLCATKEYLYFVEQNSLYRYNLLRSEKLPFKQVDHILSHGNTLIIVTQNQIIRLTDAGNTLIKPFNEKITAMSISNDNKAFFIVSQKGIIRKFNLDTLEELTHDYPAIELKKTGQITKIFQDHSGVLWVASTLGVQAINPLTVKNHPIIFDVPINALVATAVSDDIFIGSYGKGLAKINESNWHLKQLTNINGSLPKQAQSVTALLQDENTLYIGTFDGLYRLNLINQQLSKVDLDDEDVLILKMVKSTNNQLLIATDGNGLLIFDLKKQQIIDKIQQQNTLINEPLASNEVIDALVDKNNTIWITTAVSLSRYQPNTKQLQNIDVPGNSKVISLVTANDKIFVGTKGDGMFVYNLQGTLLTRIAQGVIFSYIDVIDNIIWAPAIPGLYKISPTTYQVELVANTESYSFTDKPFKINHQLYIAHYGGLLEVPLLAEKVFNPKVQISQTTVSGQTYLNRSSVKIESQSDVVSFHIASLDYRAGKTKQYQYRINQRPWNPLQGNQLTLTGLTSGRYDIEIKATNSLGQWSNQQAFAEINVTYPWYWTPQIRIFYLLMLITFILLGAWLLYLRTKSIRYVHHLLRNDLKIRGNIALNVVQQLNVAKEYIQSERLDEAKQLINESINELEQSNASTEPSTLVSNSLTAAIPYLSNYVSKKHHVNLTTHINIDEQLLSFDLQSDVYRLIYEAIMAAIRSGQSRQFRLKIKIFNDKLWITVNTESSIFLNYNNKIHFNFAMYLIRQIAQKYHATINAYVEPDDGSQLAISIPLLSEIKPSV